MVLNRETGSGLREQGGVPGAQLVLLLLFIAACSEPRPPRDFQEAFVALDQALTKERLTATEFARRFPNPTARQVVSYLMSQAGADVLQVSGSPLGENIDRLSDIPVWPPSITLWHTSRRSYAKERQVILTWDSTGTEIEAHAYVAEQDEPVYVRSWTIEHLSPSSAPDTSDTREFQAF